jgi:hypothetical protein
MNTGIENYTQLPSPQTPTLPTLHTSLPSKTQAFNKATKHKLRMQGGKKRELYMMATGGSGGRYSGEGEICVTSFVDRSIVLYINSVSSP